MSICKDCINNIDTNGIRYCNITTDIIGNKKLIGSTVYCSDYLKRDYLNMYEVCNLPYGTRVKNIETGTTYIVLQEVKVVKIYEHGEEYKDLPMCKENINAKCRINE